MPRISKNSVSLAGEFAVLSKLALRGYDASMTLGHTKSIDILLSDPRTNEMYQLEVKTKRDECKQPIKTKRYGKVLTSWQMKKAQEKSWERLWYCFVTVDPTTENTRFFIVPSKVVAAYLKDEHSRFLRDGGNQNESRTFRIGFDDESYEIPTPTVEKYEGNWEFHR